MTRCLKEILNPFRHEEKVRAWKNNNNKKITIVKADRNLRNSQSKELNMVCILTIVRPCFLDNHSIRWTAMKNKECSFKDEAEKPPPEWFVSTMGPLLMKYYGSKNEGSLHRCSSQALQMPADQQNAVVTESAFIWTNSVKSIQRFKCGASSSTTFKSRSKGSAGTSKS